jgi:cytochrome c peroxidase
MTSTRARIAGPRLRIGCGCVLFLAQLVLGGGFLRAQAQQLHLEMIPSWNDAPLVANRSISAERNISISRVDGLLSELALQRADGTWLESRDWYAFFSLERGRISALADGLPPEEFKAIRFRVGVNAKVDRTDPAEWAPSHPLHPDVCGLHWGWSSGYVFLAIEGHRDGSREKVSGFSYHLASAAEPIIVEVPASFSGKRTTTICLRLDVADVLERGKVLEHSRSTHSRDGDGLAAEMKERVSRAFRVASVRTDAYQEIPSLPREGASAKFAGTPYRLKISERLPKVKVPEDNPLTMEGVELGRKLFREKRLSKGNVQSCASCHEQSHGFTDGQRYSLGAEGRAGRRNAMPLANLAWAGELFWDGRAKSLREQVLLPIQDAHEMNESLDRVITKLAEDGEYRKEFQAAFGSEAITNERIALALEQFLLTLVSQESKFDRAARKLARLSEQEQRGLQLFVTEHDPARGLRGADCFHCHGGNLFTNHRFMNNGLEIVPSDLGRMEVTKQESDRGKFKVPSLRNVAFTGPYMHDGRFSTLEEVVEHYNGKLHRSPSLDPNLAKHPEAGLGLSEADKAALVAFLKTLTDEEFVGSKTLEKQQFTQIR